MVVEAAMICATEEISLLLHREEIEVVSDFPDETIIANVVQARRRGSARA